MTTTPSQAEKLQEMLQAMWKTSRPAILERFQTIRDAEKMLASGSLDEDARKNAESAAHKLAGVLGTFGLPQGTQLASQIEVLLASSAPIDATHAHELAASLDQLEAIIASKPI
jgi:HPt (histidine-containing phosphotransfer) domain-containing protein